MSRALRTSLPLLLTGLAACHGASSPERTAPDVDVSLYALVSTVDGTSFYPPLGPDPTASGAFDATLLGDLRVVLDATSAAGAVRTVGTFDASTTPNLLLMSKFEVYFVNVPAATYFTDPSSSYRFRVLLGTAELGRSDLSSHVFDVLATNPALTVGVKLRIEPRAAPTVTSVSPSAATAGAADTVVTIGGSGFVSDSVVLAGPEAIATTVRSSAQLTAVVPARLLASAGSLALSVRTPAPGGGTSSAVSIAIENPATIITALSPVSVDARSQLTLTVDGAGFVSGATVRVAGRALATTWISSTRLTAALDAAATGRAGPAEVVAENPSPAGAAGTASLQILGLDGDACTTATDCALGVCAGGVCNVSNLTVTSNEACVEDLAVTGATVHYVTRSATNVFSLRRVPTLGGAAATVVPTLGAGYARLVAGDDTHLLWQNQSTSNAAWAYTVGAAAPVALPYSLKAVAGGLAIGTTAFNGTFVSAPVASLTTTTVLGADSPLADEVVSADGSLFWTSARAPWGFYRMPLTGGVSTLFHEDATAAVDPFTGTPFWGLRAAGGYVYWFQASGTGYVLMRKATSGGAASVVARMSATERLSSAGLPFVVDGTSAYWSAGGAIRTVPLAGGTVSVFRTLGSLSALAVDGSAVYAGTCGGYSGQVVMRYAK